MHLQCHDDPDRRTNQGQGENNGHTNVIYRRFETWRRTFERCLHCQQTVEVGTATQKERVEEYGDYAEVKLVKDSVNVQF